MAPPGRTLAACLKTFDAARPPTWSCSILNMGIPGPNGALNAARVALAFASP